VHSKGAGGGMGGGEGNPIERPEILKKRGSNFGRDVWARCDHLSSSLCQKIKGEGKGLEKS